MRKVIICILVLLSTSVYGQSGWQKSFLSNSNNFRNITQIDSNNFIAFTFNSDICYKSSDRGVNWEMKKVFEGEYTTIWDCQFLDSDVGWCVGSESGIYGGVIYKTTDKGENWTRIQLDSSYYSWYTIQFIDGNTGWIGGWQNEVLRTTDGGNTWFEYNLPVLPTVREIKFINNSTGWVSGSTRNILKTTNGGLNWEVQLPPIRDFAAYIYSISIINEDTLWITGSFTDSIYVVHNFLIRTTNGGENWITMKEEVDNGYYLKVNFINDNTGYQFGNKNYFNKTTNGGLNWVSINTGNSTILYDMCFLNQDNIIVGGGNGEGNNAVNYLFRTTNAGDNWNIILTNRHYTFNDIFFNNVNTGYCIGTQGALFKTTNSGVSWVKFNLGHTYSLNSIYFSNDTTGFIAGDNGIFYKTIDGGSNWSSLNTQVTQNLNSIYFIGDTGWAVGSSNKIIKTEDGGSTWQLQPVPMGPNMSPHTFSSVDFIDPNTGYTLGQWSFSTYPTGYIGIDIFQTTDGGNNWVLLFNEWHIIGHKLEFINAETGYFCGRDFTKKTTNGGANWQLVFGLFSEVYDLGFVNENTGWIVGKVWNNRGRVYKTTNGGSNWYQQLDDYNRPLRSIFIIDSLNSWVVGEQSSVYKTIDGGGIISTIDPINNEIPNEFSLHQNYPNPFNPSTKIKFDIPKGSLVRLKVYDMLGREVAELVNEKLSAGVYEYEWNGAGLPSGVYFYKLEAENFIETRRMVLVK